MPEDNDLEERIHCQECGEEITGEEALLPNKSLDEEDPTGEVIHSGAERKLAKGRRCSALYIADMRRDGTENATRTFPSYPISEVREMIDEGVITEYE